jgi:hypothetical protein
MQVPWLEEERNVLTHHACRVSWNKLPYSGWEVLLVVLQYVRMSHYLNATVLLVAKYMIYKDPRPNSYRRMDHMHVIWSTYSLFRIISWWERQVFVSPVWRLVTCFWDDGDSYGSADAKMCMLLYMSKGVLLGNLLFLWSITRPLLKDQLVTFSHLVHGIMPLENVIRFPESKRNSRQQLWMQMVYVYPSMISCLSARTVTSVVAQIIWQTYPKYKQFWGQE